jgi:hypothetical protein
MLNIYIKNGLNNAEASYEAREKLRKNFVKFVPKQCKVYLTERAWHN